MARKKRRRFTPEFKAETVRLIQTSDRSISEICKELDLGETAVRRWVQQAEPQSRPVRSGALSIDEREELRRLRKEIKEVRMEREILAKATAFFAKESR